MKKLTILFILISLIKSVLLFITIKIGDYLPSLHIMLRFLFFYLAICMLDWFVFPQMKNSIKLLIWLKLFLFAFGTFLFVPFITGMMFNIYNNLFDIAIDDKVKMTWLAVFTFLLIGGFFIGVNTALWLKISGKKEEI